MSRIAYLLVSVLLIMHTAGGAEVFMSTRETITFADNLTVVVMDVEPGAGVVWLELRDEHGPLRSSVLATGESFSYDARGEGLKLTVLRIYAGGERDLVDLEVVSGEVVGRSHGFNLYGHNQDSDRPAQDGSSSLLNAGLAALLVLLLAAIAYLGTRSAGR
jgi:hypothetical protein